MSRLIQLFKEIKAEIEMERKKLMQSLNQKNLKEGGDKNIGNHGHNNR